MDLRLHNRGTEISAADILAEQESHGLAALRAERWGCVLAHATLTLDQARVLPNSPSPINAETGAVMDKA
jgi:hypothetical protein